MAASLRPRDTNTLRAAITDAGLDTVRLAHLAGITKQHVSLVLTGERGCSPLVAARIARALNIPTDRLFINHRMFGEKNSRRKQATKLTPTPVTDRYLTIEEVAERYDVPVGTLRDWRFRKIGPPFSKFGKRLRIRESVADQWFREKERATAS